ncbi:SUMO ligase siz1 [Asimina triloba]
MQNVLEVLDISPMVSIPMGYLKDQWSWYHVLNLIPKETDGERFEEALARVCRCIGGGGAAENADSDSDLEVVADSITVNLRCPMSGSRMKIAGRFKPCVHMGCFDLETFVELNQRSRKWQCPICLKNYSLENIIIDPYFNRIASLMQDCGEDVNEIDVKPDGSWRARNENEVRDLARWHNPDGSVCVTADGGEAQPEISKLRIKEEFPTDEHTSLKIGIKRNHNGIWEVSKPEDLRPNSSGNNVMERFDNPFPKVMSSGATGSYKDDEDASVNQEGGGHFEFSTNNGNEHESVNFGLPCSAANRNPAAAVTDADVIVLSDSEEENVTLISPETVCGADPTEFGGISFPVHAPGVSGSYPEDDNACLGLFSNNADDFGMPIWPLPTAPQGSGFQLFGPHTDVTDALVDESAAQSNGYGLSTDTNMGTSSHVQNTLVGRSNAEADGLVDNPLAFGNDPSLQIFLPARPAGASVQDEARDHADMSNGIRSEDWISLRLGGGTSHTEPIDGNGLHSRKHHASKDGGMGPSDTDNNGNNAASFFQNMNNGDDGRSDKAGWRRPRSGDPFSHPRQPRSVRPRLPLSIDIDSE